MASYVVNINGIGYTLHQEPKAYEVTEVPSHYDIDPKMERRVIYNDFSMGILRRRDQKSIDQNSQSPYVRQTRAAEGVWWGNGCDPSRQDRIFAQRGVTANPGAVLATNPAFSGDGNVYSYLATQKQFYSVASNQTITLSKDFSAVDLSVTDVASFGGAIWVASVANAAGNADFSQPQGLWHWDQATTTTAWAQAPGFATPGYGGGDTGLASCFVVIRSTLWRAANANMWSVNAGDANWSGKSVIGDSGTNITALDVYKDALIIFKQDGVYSMDRAGQVYPVFPGFRTLGFNPRPICQWRGSYYFASDVGNVWEWDGNAVNRIGFDTAEPYPMASGVFGIPNVATRGIGLPNFMVVGFNQYSNGSNFGYYLAYDGKAWHPFRYFSNGRVASLGITGGNKLPVNPTLQFGLLTGGTPLNYYMTTPTLDPFLITLYDASAQDLYLPSDSGAIEDEDKVLEKVNVLVDQAKVGTIRISYALDDAILALNYQSLGPPTGDRENTQVFTVPQGVLSYKKIALKVTITPDATTATPMIRQIVLHYKQRGPQRRVWKMKLILDEHAVGQNARVDTRSTKKKLADLNAARQLRTPIPFTDLQQEQWQVYVDEVGEDMAIFKATSQGASYFVNVTLVEATSN